MNKKLRLIYASSWAATVAVIFATVVTIWGELHAPFKNWLKSVTGHHWTTKSWFTVGIFILFLFLIYAFKREPTDMQVRGGLKWLIFIAVLCVLVLFGFFAIHYLVV